MSESSPVIGVVQLPPPIQKIRRDTRSFNKAPGEKGRSACHYCLEPLASVEVESRRACPVCCHIILTPCLGTAVHLFNRLQQWDLLANEMDYIWRWEYALFREVRHKPLGSLFEFEYEKQDFEALGDAKYEVLGRRDAFLDQPGDLEDLIGRYLDSMGYFDGHLAVDLARGRKWREMAKDLSAEGAGLAEITWFQVQLVKDTCWGAFGYYPEEKEKILRFLEGRADRLKKG